MLLRILKRVDQQLRTQPQNHVAGKQLLANLESRGIAATVLEDRVLYSASPLAEIGESVSSAGAAAEIEDHGLLADGTSEKWSFTDDQSSQESASVVDLEALAGDAARTSREIVLIDSSVDDVQTLLDDLFGNDDHNRDIEVVLLTADRDGVEQISEVLARQSDIDAIHILSHGSQGQVQLGNTTLSSDNIDAYAGQLAGWGSALDTDADILFYGCDLADGEGQEFVESIATLCDCDVAASDDATGHEDLGGDWVLEVHAGTIETDVAFSQSAQQNWESILATYTVTNTNSSGAGSLRQAILDANANGGDDTIQFNISGTGIHTINVGASGLPQITDTVTLDATTDNSFAANGNAPAIILNGGGNNVFGIDLSNSADGSTIQGLILRNFASDAIFIRAGSNNNTIIGNYIGALDSDGEFTSNAQKNFGAGILVQGANNTIGGTTAALRNVVSGNGDGIQISGSGATGNQVIGNYIGLNAAGDTSIGNDSNGIAVDSGATNNTIGGSAAGEGNLIADSNVDGIYIHGESTDNNTIQGNWIGINAAGTAAFGNGEQGIAISDGADNTLIGGSTAAEGNWIAASGQSHILMNGASTDTIIQNNRMGTDLAGTANWGSQDSGIYITNSFGTPKNSVIQENIIAFSGQSGSGGDVDGILILNANVDGHAILQNSIYSSHGIGIDLNNDGVTANDAGDGDGGPNARQNYPVLTSVTSSSGDTTIVGTLNSNSSTTYRIEFFSSPSGDGTGHGEAETYLGATTVTTNGSGNASFNTTLSGVTVATGHVVTATATVDLGGGNYGSTSEFAQNIAVTGNTVTVDTTSDVSDGNTSSIAALYANRGADGLISLREAIEATNNTANVDASTPDVIEFKVIAAPVGGSHTFVVSSALSVITESVVIDATTDPTFAANGNQPTIIIDGNATTNTAFQQSSTADGSTFKGMVIRNFDEFGIWFEAGSDNNTVVGNYIGTLGIDGELEGNGIGAAGIHIEGANNTIGGATAELRNIISGNFRGVELEGSSATGNLVIGNYVGTNASGTATIENTNGGIYAHSGANANTIGGSNVGEGNVISGNTQYGVEIRDEDSDNNVVRGNWIGVSADGLTNLGNDGSGIKVLFGADNTQIGGPGANDGNWITGSTLRGIHLSGDPISGTLIQNNRIGTDLAGTANWGSGQAGISITTSGVGAGDNQILQNVIAFSGQDGPTTAGIVLKSTAGPDNTILGNQIYSSVGVGIDLNNDGFTANDSGDGDNGANGLQNFPVLASALSTGGDTTIDGTLNSNASTTYRIEFFSSASGDASGYGEAETYLGFTTVTTDASGDASFSAVLTGVTVTAGHTVTATATVDLGGGNFGGTSEFAANVTATANSAPVGSPTITGTAAEDQTLTADTSGISDADGLGTFSYQWLRDGSVISGATASTYTLGDADVGTQISVRVTYTDGNGTAEGPLTSSQTSAVTNVNDTPSGTPTVTGTATENETLTADTSGISDDDGLGTFSYQWLRDGSVISGATASTYTLGDADVGSQISVRVTYIDGNGTAEGPLTSSQTSAVTNVNDAPSGTPTITGTAAEDQTLTADTSGISDDDGLGTFSYQWLRDGSVIGGATASTYTLSDADVGTQISVSVTYTDGNGTAEGPLTSTQTSAVTNVNDAPSGTPTVTGTATENETLTADTSGISDDDGLGTFSYQWLRDGSVISGATGSTHTLGAADVGSQISVRVSYTDGNGTAEGPLTSSQTSAVTNVNDAPSGTPTVTGTATENETLTADTSGISDADGLGPFSYQWLRDGSVISGATASTYTLGDADVGSQISVRVTYTDGNGTAEGPLTSSQTSAVTNVNDAPVGTPTVTGTPTEDETLTADTSGISDDDGLGTFSYQWQRDGSVISGATASTYTLSDADVGSQISVRVTYTDGNGTAEGPLTSAQTSAVTNVNDAPSGTPTVTGTVTEDQTLTADTSGISDDDGLGTFSYQWLRDGSVISGATGSTHTLSDADVGSQISVRVSYTDGNGTAEGPLNSAQTSAVTNVNDAPSGTPTVTGTVTENETLAADTSGISDADGLGPFSYQWLRDGSVISGATGSTHTLSDADVGTQISVRVNYTDGRGTPESVTSAPTSTVTNVNDTPSGTPTITGTAAEDQTLTADTSGISDADGLGTFSYQWLRDGSAISGATGSTHTLSDADVGSQISVHVIYTDGNGTTEGPLTSSQTSAVTNINDAPSGTPTVTGTATENETLTADTSGISDDDGLGTFSYQWLRDGSVISGATASTYTLGDADVGSQISVRVTYTDGNGTAEGPLTSTQTSAVTNVNDAPSGTPAITGTAAEDQTLTADTSGISDDDGLVTFSYQWLRDGSTISGATTSTYTLDDADVGSQISVQVSYTDGNGTAEGPLISTQTSAVININDAPSGTLTINGAATEDQILTADTSGLSDPDGLGSFTYQWFRDGSEINGATDSTYVPGDEDVGKEITYEVTYRDERGMLEGPLVSLSTGPIANVNDAPVAVNDAYEASPGAPLIATVTGGLLRNDYDIEGDRLVSELVFGPANGTLVLNPDGSFQYTPMPGFNGEVEFTYLVHDGTDNSNIATVSISVSSGSVTVGEQDSSRPDHGGVLPASDSDDDDSREPTQPPAQLPLLSEHVSSFDGSSPSRHTFDELTTASLDEEKISYGVSQFIDSEEWVTVTASGSPLWSPPPPGGSMSVSLNPLTVTEYSLEDVQYALDEMQVQKQQSLAGLQFFSVSMSYALIGAGAGISMWVTNAAALSTLLASALPPTAGFDPLFVLRYGRTKKDEGDESVAQLIQSSQENRT